MSTSKIYNLSMERLNLSLDAATFASEAAEDVKRIEIEREYDEEKEEYVNKEVVKTDYNTIVVFAQNKKCNPIKGFDIAEICSRTETHIENHEVFDVKKKYYVFRKGRWDRKKLVLFEDYSDCIKFKNEYERTQALKKARENLSQNDLKVLGLV